MHVALNVFQPRQAVDRIRRAVERLAWPASGGGASDTSPAPRSSGRTCRPGRTCSRSPHHPQPLKRARSAITSATNGSHSHPSVASEVAMPENPSLPATSILSANCNCKPRPDFCRRESLGVARGVRPSRHLGSPQANRAEEFLEFESSVRCREDHSAGRWPIRAGASAAPQPECPQRTEPAGAYDRIANACRST